MHWKVRSQSGELLENPGTCESLRVLGGMSLKGLPDISSIPSHELSGFSLGVLPTTGPQCVYSYKFQFIRKVTVTKKNLGAEEMLSG